MKKKAITTQQYVIIGAAVVILLIAGYYLTRPKPEVPDDEPNKSPIVVGSALATFTQMGDTVDFSAEGSRDPDGEIVSYDWDFGDGNTGNGVTVSHKYDIPGDYVITVTVVDDEGASSSNDVTPIFIKVDRPELNPTVDSPPFAIIAVSGQVVDESEEVTFDAVSSYGWKMRRGEITPDLTKITAWEWDFGDGSTGEGEEATHMYASSGNYAVLLEVTDDQGQTDEVIRTIRVLPPGSEYVGEIKNPDTYIFATDLTISSSLDLWRISGGNVGRQIVTTLSDMLVWTGPGDIEPQTEGSVSESWEISDDGLQYTFHLREGINFWNGDEMTAEDVEYTYERIMALTADRGRWSLDDERMTGALRDDVTSGAVYPEQAIKDAVEVIDDYTIRFNFKEPYAPFLVELAYPSTGIIQKKHAIDNGAWSWDNPFDYAAVDGVDKPMEDGIALMGTGPYKGKEWSKGERIVFERNDDYWKGPAKLEFVRFLVVPEWSTRSLMLTNGDADGIAVHNVEAFEQMVNTDGVTAIQSKYAGFLEIMCLGINFDPDLQPPENQVPPDFLADKHMRKAFAYAFPYERYIQEIWLGYAEAARGVLPPGWPGAFEDYPFTYDLAKAEEELKLAHDGLYYEEGFQIAFGYQLWAASTHGRAYEMLAEEFAKIDPKFKVVGYGTSWGDMLNSAAGMLVGVIRLDPNSYRSFYHSEGWSSYYGYKNERVDELLDAATLTPFLEERIPLIEEATAIAADEAPFIYTVYNPFLVAVRDYIGGYWYQVNHVVDGGYFHDITKGQ
jgi:peptide/nickel transport system substrate-binding protein